MASCALVTHEHMCSFRMSAQSTCAWLYCKAQQPCNLTISIALIIMSPAEGHRVYTQLFWKPQLWGQYDTCNYRALIGEPSQVSPASSAW